ncbi:SPOR domain-containing protein [Thermosynechococcus sp.]|uniref:SPOR domain-containing protein n=1 Tax=Thermosynechococcus sp. TaxID=2814275 RepID=UPI0039188EB5
MTSATIDRQRLQAALACLNLSLEAELTQYRCHRMVQAHSPFDTPPVPESATPSEPSIPPVSAAEPVSQVVPPVVGSLAVTSETAAATDERLNEVPPDPFFEFDPTDLAELLPQSYASDTPGPQTPTPTKRPFASTRELLKQARHNQQRPWFQQRGSNSQHLVQRWLIVVGMLAGFSSAALWWFNRRPAPVATESPSPVPATPTAESPTPPVGPDMTAREFPDVNRSTLAQLEPAASPAPSASPTPATNPASAEPEHTTQLFVEKMPNGRYYVLAPYKEPADLEKVQAVVPDAFLVGNGDQTKIQLGMFLDEASAQAMVNQLRDRL